MLVSIIVPIYNSEDYIDRCVKSILSQTHTDFECLLIDDGSTDSSRSICDNYVRYDSRVRVLAQNNGGVTRARQLGVQNAKGDWIAFVDADDELYDYSLQILLSNISSDIDIVIANSSCECIMDRDEFIRATLLSVIKTTVWGRLYRKSLFDAASFEIDRALVVGEDQVMNLRVGGNVGFVKCIDAKVYEYHYNINSITNTRKFTLEHEELYLHEVNKSFGGEINKFSEELCWVKLGVLENMIVCRVPVSYGLPWIQELKFWSQNQKLSLRYWIVMHISNNLFCKLLLAVEKRIRQCLKIK